MKKILMCSTLALIFFMSCKNQNNENENAEVVETEISTMRPIYIGTYTKKEGHVDGQAEGIYSVYQDPETGELKMGETVANITNPSFVRSSNDNQNLYAVSELDPRDNSAVLL